MSAEYASAATTTELTHWLMIVATSPDLLDDGHAIIGDELLHAKLSHRVCIEAGTVESPEIQQGLLRLPRDPGAPVLQDITRACVRAFCINETLAVPLFAAMRKNARVPVAREALDQILRDEVRHRDFGWTLLEWLVETGGHDVRAWAAETADNEVGRRRAQAAAMAEGPAGRPLPDDDAAWGLLPGARYGEILTDTVAQEFRPRFEALAIDLSRRGRGRCHVRRPRTGR